MENIEELRKSIDTAMMEERWSDVVKLGKKVPYEIDEPTIRMQSGLALYHLSEYRGAADAMLSVLIDLHEQLVETPSDTDLILVYVTCRSTLLLCQFKSVGTDARTITLQTMELEERIAGWRMNLALENTPIPLFDALKSAVGLP